MTVPLFIKGRAWQANSYIVDTILVDAGVTPDRVVPYKDSIDTIVLTHGHYDHIVHAQEISDLTGAQIYIGEFDMPFLTDPALSLSPHFGAAQPVIRGAKPLVDGDRVGEFVVCHTPGHTCGSICLFRESDGVLVCGDTVFPEGSYGRCDLPTGCSADIVSSLARLSTLFVSSLWCGHGEPVYAGAMEHVRLSAAVAAKER